MDENQVDRDALALAFKEFQQNARLPDTLPQNPVTEQELDDLGDLKADVVLYGMAVAGPVLSLIDGKIPRHPLRRNDSLRRRIDKLLQEGSPAAVDKAREYAQYVDALHSLVDRVSGYAAVSVGGDR